MNILGKRYLFLLLSAIFILPGLVLLVLPNWGLPLAIDFTGGALLEAKFESGKAPEAADVINLYNEMGVTNTQIQTSGADVLIIRTPALDDEQRSKLVSSIETKFNDKVTVLKFDVVGPVIGQEVTGRAGLAILVAFLLVIIYITFAFRGVENAWRYGVCAVVATLHDLLIMMALSAYGGHFLGWQIDSLYLTAILTVVGFSTQDTIVVFDRIRENSNIHRKISFEQLVNHSVVQTLQRSINTQLMTSEFLLLSLALLGGVTLREFAVVLLVGLASGTYSSIFIAATVLVIWENKEWRNWFGRKPSMA